MIYFNLAEVTFTVYFIFSKGIPLFDYIFHAVAALAVTVSLFLWRKNKKPLMFSFGLLVLAEIWRALSTIIPYYGTLSFDTCINLVFNLIAAFVLSFLAISTIKTDKYYNLLIVFSIIFIIVYACLYFPPSIFLHRSISVSLITQNFFTFAMFGALGSSLKRKGYENHFIS